MRTITRALSRMSFAAGGAALFIGLHRFVFGVHPKLIWDRDLPWDLVSYEWCFASALALAFVGALLGRASRVDSRQLTADGARASLGEPELGGFNGPTSARKDIVR